MNRKGKESGSKGVGNENLYVSRGNRKGKESGRKGVGKENR